MFPSNIPWFGNKGILVDASLFYDIVCAILISTCRNQGKSEWKNHIFAAYCRCVFNLGYQSILGDLRDSLKLLAAKMGYMMMVMMT